MRRPPSLSTLDTGRVLIVANVESEVVTVMNQNLVIHIEVWNEITNQSKIHWSGTCSFNIVFESSFCIVVSLSCSNIVQLPLQFEINGSHEVQGLINMCKQLAFLSWECIYQFFYIPFNWNNVIIVANIKYILVNKQINKNWIFGQERYICYRQNMRKSKNIHHINMILFCFTSHS